MEIDCARRARAKMIALRELFRARADLPADELVHSVVDGIAFVARARRLPCIGVHSYEHPIPMHAHHGVLPCGALYSSARDHGVERLWMEDFVTVRGNDVVVLDGHGGKRVAQAAAEIGLDASLSFADAVAKLVVDLHDVAAANPRTGSTLLAARVHAAGAEIAWLGDSPAFLIHDDEVRALTPPHNHTHAGERERLGRHIWDDRLHGSLAMTRALGDHEFRDAHGARLVGTNADFVRVDAQPGDVLLLCSDGVETINEVSLPYIIQALRAHSYGHMLAEMLATIALATGSDDNVSIVAICF